MQVSSHAKVAYTQPIVGSGAVVERAAPKAAAIGTAPASVVSITPEAEAIAVHMDEAGPHPPDGCETCSRLASPTDGDSDAAKIAELKARDAEVRRHEQAHLAAAGQYARGGPSYEYERGPDGKQYVVGGHVSIDTSEVRGDPQATLKKAQVVRRAALAPAEPSGQDRRVAAQASAMAAKAQRELASELAEADGTDAGTVRRAQSAYAAHGDSVSTRESPSTSG